MGNYEDRNLSVEERVEELLASLSTDQKIGQLMCRMMMEDSEQSLEDYPCGVGEAIVSKQAKTPADVANNNHEAIDAIMKKTGGIPPVIHVEALSGLLSFGATSFPLAIGLVSTFDAEAIEEMSTIIRKQMMAIGTRRALSPVMDVA